MRSCEEQEVFFSPLISNFTSLPQYLQMKWPLLDVPGSAGLKDSRSPTPGHLVSSCFRKPPCSKLQERRGGGSSRFQPGRSLRSEPVAPHAVIQHQVVTVAQTWTLFCSYIARTAAHHTACPRHKISACVINLWCWLGSATQA